MLTGRSRYEDIKNLYVERLAHIWMEDSTPEEIRISIEEKMDSFAEGDLEHAGEILSALWDVANEDKDEDAKPNAGALMVSPFLFYFLKRGIS